ncbi:unnamed protein product [Lampetra fluviatilis]
MAARVMVGKAPPPPPPRTVSAASRREEPPDGAAPDGATLQEGDEGQLTSPEGRAREPQSPEGSHPVPDGALPFPTAEEDSAGLQFSEGEENVIEVSYPQVSGECEYAPGNIHRFLVDTLRKTSVRVGPFLADLTAFL